MRLTAAESVAAHDAPGPTLATRIAFALAGVMLLIALAAMGAVQQVLTSRLAAVEQDLAVRHRELQAETLKAQIARVETLAADWSRWDDLYQFATGSKAAVAGDSVSQRILERLDLDFMIVLDLAGRVLRAESRGLPVRTLHEVTRTFTSAYHAAAGSNAHAPAGLAATTSGPMVAALHTVERVGTWPAAEPRLVIVGHRFRPGAAPARTASARPEDIELHRLDQPGGLARARVVLEELRRRGQPAMVTVTATSMVNHTLLRDVTGAHAYLLEARLPRTISALGKSTADVLMGIILLAALLALLTAWLVVRRVVVGPLGRLSAHILALRRYGGYAPVPGREADDEIGRLARDFEELLVERHESQRRLEHFAAALEHAGDAVAILDDAKRIIYVNPMYEKQSGYTREEVVGRIPQRGGDSGIDFDAMWAQLRAGRVWCGRINTRRRDGAARVEELTVAPLMEADHVVKGFVAVMRDITEQQRTAASLKRLATVVEHAADAIMVLDASGRVEYVNPAFERRRGVRLDDVVGMTPGGILRGQDEPGHYDRMRSVARAGGVWSGRIRTCRPDGSLLVESAVLSPIFDEEGCHASYAVILHDLTRREQLEAELAEARRLEAVGRLAAGVAHEINTPTQYIGDNVRFLGEAFGELEELLAALESLVKESRDDFAATVARLLQAGDVAWLRSEVPAAIRQSLEGIERVGEIVRSMKVVSHPAASDEPVDLNLVVKSAVAMSSPEWKPAAELALELDPDLPPVPCRAAGISQVVVNLVVNAAQAIHAVPAAERAGPGRIVVRTRRAASRVEIEVCDDGPGMTPEVRERIFDPFYTTKPVGMGTGQGLPLAHAIVQKHGGSIYVRTAPGEGASFTVGLPLVAAKAQDRAA